MLTIRCWQCGRGPVDGKWYYVNGVQYHAICLECMALDQTVKVMLARGITVEELDMIQKIVQQKGWYPAMRNIRRALEASNPSEVTASSLQRYIFK